VLTTRSRSDREARRQDGSIVVITEGVQLASVSWSKTPEGEGRYDGERKDGVDGVVDGGAGGQRQSRPAARATSSGKPVAGNDRDRIQEILDSNQDNLTRIYADGRR